MRNHREREKSKMQDRGSVYFMIETYFIIAERWSALIFSLYFDALVSLSAYVFPSIDSDAGSSKRRQI